MEMKYDELDLNVIERSGHFKNDADTSVFFARELEAVKAKTYDQKSANLNALNLFPMSTEVDAGAETITYQSFGQVGMAKIVANYATDFPRVDVEGEEHSARVFSIGASYGYSVQDVRAARLAGKPLNQRKATAVRRAIDEKINSIAFNGDEAHGIVGILKNPNISTYTLTADGTGSATEFKKKTPVQILRDLNAAVSSVIELTNGVEVPDTVVLPIAQYNYLSNTPYSDSIADSILTVFKKNNPYIKDVFQAAEMAGAGASGKDIALIYVRDADHVTVECPMPFMQYNVQQDNMEYKVPCEARTAGVLVYYPLSMVKVEGI